MMKLIKNKVFVVFLFSGLLLACNKDDGGINIPLDNEVNEFVWEAMRGYYYWEAEVEDLSVEKYPTYNQLYEFLNEFESSEAFFEHLLVDQDRFSWIVDDYDELEASFQGTGKSYGYELGLARLSGDENRLLGYVKYVVPDGPAERAGLKRGDFFLTVDNTSLTLDNYVSLLLASSSYTLKLSQIEDGSIVETDQEVSLVAEVIAENPILISKVLEVQGQKVGYLMYNQFISNNVYHQEMNDVFGRFNSEGITDLVLDLRYNGGGSLLTSRLLSSMIYGAATSNDILGSLVYNENLSESNVDFTFLDVVPILDGQGGVSSTIPMNRLSINRIFILTTGSSASASEFVIAGLLPFMDVTLIGTKTVGKNVASITFYDSPESFYQEKGPDLNPNHKYAIQPIVSQLSNSVGFTDYINGLEPNIQVDEIDLLGNFAPLGDPSELLLSEALGIITGSARADRRPDIGHSAFYPKGPKEYLNTVLIESNDIPEAIK
ncbi:MAG: peptidase S41 [Ekhidna sp.]|nr:peptidase S41 [Ekhidna sp.]